MSNPIIGIGTDIGVIKETSPGEREATPTTFLDVISESLDYVPVLHRIQPVLGDRQANAGFEFVSHNDGGGGINTRLRYGYCTTLMEWITGDASSPHVPIVDNTDLPVFTVECEKANMNDVVLVGAKVNTATFRSSTNLPLECELELVAMSGVRDAGDLTAASYAGWTSTAPIIHGLMAFDATGHAFLGGASGPECRSIEFTLNNNLDPEGFCNSQTRKIIPVGIFDLTGSMEIPYNATSKAFWASMIAATRVKFSLTYSDSETPANTVAFAFVVKLDGVLPPITGAENIWLTLNFHGVADTTDPACITITETAGS